MDESLKKNAYARYNDWHGDISAGNALMSTDYVSDLLLVDRDQWQAVLIELLILDRVQTIRVFAIPAEGARDYVDHCVADGLPVEVTKVVDGPMSNVYASNSILTPLPEQFPVRNVAELLTHGFQNLEIKLWWNPRPLEQSSSAPHIFNLVTSVIQVASIVDADD